MKISRLHAGPAMCAALMSLGACSGPASSPEVMSMQHNAMMVLATADRGEIEESQLALQRASSPAVRQFAQTMIAQHTADLQNQTAMMGMRGGDMQNGMAMSGSMAGGDDVVQALQSGHQQAMSMLSGLSGAAFDRAYMQRQVDAHSYLLNYTGWLMRTQGTLVGGDTMLVGASLEGVGPYAVPLSCDPGRSEAAPGSGRSESGNTSAGNMTAVGTCDGTPQVRPPLHGSRMTNADALAMNRGARGMIASHLQMARQVMSGL
jgi:predicted outer membrane protein